MPTYDWKCDLCGYEQETFERMSSDPAPRMCPACQTMNLIRLIGTGVVADAKLKRERMYPYISYALPRQKDPRTGRRTVPVVVQSVQHEREIMAGALDGRRWSKGDFNKEPDPNDPY